MTDDHPVDDRLRRAWADLSPADGDLSAAPDAIWTSVARHAARPANRRLGPWLLAAAVAVVVGLGLVTTLIASDGPAADQVAVLSPDDVDGPASARGDASIIDRGDDRVLEVDLSGLPDPGPGTVVEVWLLDPGTGTLQAMGLADTGTARLTVPRAVDLDRFTVVDVSFEPLDGDPGHSAESILRGTLEPA